MSLRAKLSVGSAERLSKLLLIDALQVAYGRRNPPQVHHSDKTSYYTSHTYE